MSPEDRTRAVAREDSGPADPVAAGFAAYEALERELDRTFCASSEPRQCLTQPLATVRTALRAAATDPAAKEGLAAALDVLEDVLEALLRATGWPAAAAERGEPV
jgi:hypothetical protein